MTFRETTRPDKIKWNYTTVKPAFSGGSACSYEMRYEGFSAKMVQQKSRLWKVTTCNDDTGNVGSFETDTVRIAKTKIAGLVTRYHNNFC